MFRDRVSVLVQTNDLESVLHSLIHSRTSVVLPQVDDLLDHLSVGALGSATALDRLGGCHDRLWLRWRCWSVWWFAGLSARLRGSEFSGQWFSG